MAEPSFMDDLTRSAQERLAEIRAGVGRGLEAVRGVGRPIVEGIDAARHAVQPVTDRLASLSRNPAQFAREGLQAGKELLAPLGAAVGTAGVMGAGVEGIDPSMRENAPEELMDPAIAAVPPEQRRAAIARAIQERALQRNQTGFSQ